jgi:predicted acylesterase/phospholipase RssA
MADKEGDSKTEIENPVPKKIKHLVISGGGTIGFMFYGALKESNLQGLWKFEDIETIYGTSVGSIVAIIIAMKFDWKVLDDYLIKRPWQNVFHFNMGLVLSSFHEKGIFGINVIEQIFQPLFSAQDISMDITVGEFYEKTKIEVHMLITNINTLQLIDISYKTHPEWRLLDAVYCSCALPIMFKPIFVDSSCYCDGGCIRNYPNIDCVNAGADPEEIFGLCKHSKMDPLSSRVNESSSIFDYLYSIISKIFLVHLSPKFVPIKNELILEIPITSISEYFNSMNSPQEREKLIQIGKDAFLKKYGTKDGTKDGTKE